MTERICWSFIYGLIFIIAGVLAGVAIAGIINLAILIFDAYGIGIATALLLIVVLFAVGFREGWRDN